MHILKSLRFILFFLVLTSLSISLATSEELSLETSTGVLYGTLQHPTNGSNSNTVTLIIAGSGPTDRDGNTPILPGNNNSLKLLAQGLADLGYASLRTDKRGVAASQNAGSAEADLRFTTYVTDMVDWLTYLHNEQNFENIIIIGHSEGSLIGMLVAQQPEVRDLVSAFISISSPGFPAQDILRIQLAEQLTKPMMLGVEEVLQSLEAGKLVTELPNSIASVPPVAALFRDSVQPYLISWFAYDPSEVIAELDIPILIIQGNHDIQVSVEDAEELHRSNDISQLSIIDEMNHVLKIAPKERMLNLATYSDPTLPLADEFIDSIDTFFDTIHTAP